MIFAYIINFINDTRLPDAVQVLSCAPGNDRKTGFFSLFSAGSGKYMLMTVMSQWVI